MIVSSKGAKDNTLKLIWTKYYKYSFDNKDYYFKQKAYTTYSDGFIKTEQIKKETYRNAVKRKNKCYEVRLEDKAIETEIDILASIFHTRYQIAEIDIKNIIINVNQEIKKLKEKVIINNNIENTMFLKKIQDEIKKR